MKAATTMPNSLDREIFEKWAEANGYAAFNDDDNEYSNADTHHAWLGWQAGAAAERQKINAEHASKVPHAEMEKLQSAVKVLRDRSAP